jgi:PKD repeat protein
MLDATGSFDADQPSLTISNYTWTFGNDPPLSTSLLPKVQHVFAFPGNYPVRLVVADQSGRGNLTRTVKVLPNLGTLRLEVRDQLGIPMRGNVFVLLFNSTVSPSPFERAITSPAGVVLLANLVPGLYSIDFSGQNVVAGHRVTEKVIGGWETADTVYITVDTPPVPPDYSGIVFIASILAGVTLFTVAIILKRRSDRRKLKPGTPRRSAG